MKIKSNLSGLVAVVPVREGSKGLVGKNIRLLDGVPLYLHAVRQGMRTVGRVLVSTDIAEIDQKNLPEGCILCPRPVEFATDHTPMAPVIAHLIETQFLHGCTLVLLQATSPLREDADIAAAVALHAEGCYDLVMSVVERDRSVLKYGTLSDGDFIAMRDPSFCFQNRQMLPPVYGPNGAVYVFSAAEFMNVGNFPTRRIGAVEMPATRSVDIDTVEDFRHVEDVIIARRVVEEKRC